MLLEILLLAVPVGFLIAWMARDELVSGRGWFRGLVVVGVVLGVGGWLFGFNSVGWSGGFVAVVSFVSYWKSYDRGWVKK